MAAVKTNERPGTRARASYVRSSAYKAREVLDLIRGKSCAEAQDILAFCERDVAQPIGKVLDSAIANAEHNDSLDAEELYVSACYADEGPTLKRWRPRARGRATRIRKRTCHITVIVSRYDPETLDRMRARLSRAGVAASEARRRRVARSRAAAQQQSEAADEADTGVDAQAAAVVEATEAAMVDSGSAHADDAAEAVEAVDETGEDAEAGDADGGQGSDDAASETGAAASEAVEAGDGDGGHDTKESDKGDGSG